MTQNYNLHEQASLKHPRNSDEAGKVPKESVGSPERMETSKNVDLGLHVHVQFSTNGGPKGVNEAMVPDSNRRRDLFKNRNHLASVKLMKFKVFRKVLDVKMT